MTVKLISTPAVALDPSGRLNVLAAGEDYNAYAIEQVAPNNGWSGWLALGAGAEKGGGFFVDGQPLALAVDRVIDTLVLTAYAVSLNGALHSQNKLPDWSQAWRMLPSRVRVWFYSSAAVVGLEGKGLGGQRRTATAFAVGERVNELAALQQSTATGWVAHPGATLAQDRPVAVAPSRDGRLELFAVDVDWQILYHIWETAVGGAWSGWFSHGSPGPGIYLLPAPALAAGRDGRLELFVVGTTNPMHDASVGSLYHMWQTAPSNGWSKWFSHDGPPGTELRRSPAVAAGKDGRLEVFVVGGDGAVYHKWQVAPNNGWSGWYSHGTPGGVQVTLEASPAVAASQDGRLELFVVGVDGALYHKWQVAPNNGWSAWYSHASPP